MNKKIISLVLIAALATSVAISSSSISAKAATAPTAKVNSATNNQKSKDMLKEIESKYLIQNSDGTFSLKDSVYKKFDSTTIDNLKSSMNNINNLILKGELQFDIVKSGSSQKVVNTKADIDAMKKDAHRPSLAGSGVLASYDYCSNYEWYWYGFDCDVNSAGCQLLYDDFEGLAAVYGVGTLIATAEGVGLPFAALSVMTVGKCMYQAKLGIDDGNGARAYCLGSPSSCAVWQVWSY